MSLQLTDYVIRPGNCTTGKPVRVRSNFFEIQNFPLKVVHHYDITIDQANAPPAVYRKVWKQFEDTGGQGILHGIRTIYDGRKNVFAPSPLNLGPENSGQYEVI